VQAGFFLNPDTLNPGFSEEEMREMQLDLVKTKFYSFSHEDHNNALRQDASLAAPEGSATW
ncbi:MAG: hypothetical protein WCL16_07570, partial [bacterium]